jgi:hypothetical protein
MINYADKQGTSASKILNEVFMNIEKFWTKDISSDKPLEYTAELRTHSTRATTITLLSEIHAMDQRWVDNRAGLLKKKTDTAQTYFRGSCKSDTSCALALSGWSNPTAENGKTYNFINY